MVIEFLRAKIATMVGLWIVTFISTYFPWFLNQHFRRSLLIMSFCNCLAGGVIFGTMLIHVMPILFEHDEGESGTWYHKYPMGALMAGISFLVLLGIDRLFLSYTAAGQTCYSSTTLSSNHDHHLIHTVSNNLSQQRSSAKTVQEIERGGEALHGHHQKFDSKELIRMQCCERCPLKNCFKQRDAIGSCSVPTLGEDLWLIDQSPDQSISPVNLDIDGQTPLPLHHLIHPTDSTIEPISPSLLLVTNTSNTAANHEIDLNNNHFKTSGFKPNIDLCDLECNTICGETLTSKPSNTLPSNVREFSTIVPIKEPNERASRTHAFIFVLALSLHSFLEGLGLSPINNQDRLKSYIIGLCGHKWLEAFALGMTIFNARFSKSTNFILNLLYSSLTPLGILLGILITNQESTGTLTVVILTGLSVGSFLFVCCVEMIPPEFAIINRYSPYKFLCVLIGFVTMACWGIREAQ